MPLYLHQWRYKDGPIRQMLEHDQAPNRADFVRTAVEEFSGTLHGFYYALGDYDGVAITEFPDEQTALACIMLIYGQGRLREVRTTTLFPPDATLKAILQAQGVLNAK